MYVVPRIILYCGFVVRAFRKYLILAQVHTKLFTAVRDFCEEDEKINTRAERPMSRPARLPMAQTAFEIMNIDFFEFDKHVILHMQDVFTRFSILKYMGGKKVH